MKTAIKHMTAAQLHAEELEVKRRRLAIHADRADLFDRRDPIANERRGLTRRLHEIGKRVLEIANSTTAPAGEVEGLLTQQSDLIERIEMILSSERDLHREIDANFALEDALDRREEHLRKRAWQLQFEAA